MGQTLKHQNFQGMCVSLSLRGLDIDMFCTPIVVFDCLYDTASRHTYHWMWYTINFHATIIVKLSQSLPQPRPTNIVDCLSIVIWNPTHNGYDSMFNSSYRIHQIAGFNSLNRQYLYCWQLPQISPKPIQNDHVSLSSPCYLRSHFFWIPPIREHVVVRDVWNEW